MHPKPTFNIKAGLESGSCYRAELQIFVLTPDSMRSLDLNQRNSEFERWCSAWAIIEQRLRGSFALEFMSLTQTEWVEKTSLERRKSPSIEFWIADRTESKTLTRWMRLLLLGAGASTNIGMPILATRRNDSHSLSLWNRLALGPAVCRLEELVWLTPAFRRLVQQVQ